MTFEYWRGQRPSAPAPEPEPLPAAIPETLAAEFAERAWGESDGLSFSPPPTATTVQTGLVVEPPPWAGQAPLSAPEPDTGPAPTAAEQMQLAGEVYDPAPFRPAANFAPFRPCPIDIPAPDWRAEEP